MDEEHRAPDLDCAGEEEEEEDDDDEIESVEEFSTGVIDMTKLTEGENEGSLLVCRCSIY